MYPAEFFAVRDGVTPRSNWNWPFDADRRNSAEKSGSTLEAQDLGPGSCPRILAQDLAPGSCPRIFGHGILRARMPPRLPCSRLSRRYQGGHTHPFRKARGVREPRFPTRPEARICAGAKPMRNPGASPASEPGPLCALSPRRLPSSAQQASPTHRAHFFDRCVDFGARGLY
jgi:hypothetical protein